MNYIGRKDKIVGRIIDINEKTQTGRFWIQHPKRLKNILLHGRHRPNVFDFNNLNDLSYLPKKNDIITASVSISNKSITFYNISKKNTLSKTKTLSKTNRNNRQVYKTKRNNTNKNKRKNRNISSKNVRIQQKTPPVTTKPRPRVFMILGHSYECILEKIDINPKVYEILKKEYENQKGYFEFVTNNSNINKNPQYIFFKELEETINTVDSGMTEWLVSKWGTSSESKIEPAFYFNKTRFDNNQSGFLCDKSCSTFFGKDELILLFEDTDKLALVEDPSRIDLRYDFEDILPNNQIKFLNGQSTGRAGLISTSFNIMEFMQKKEDFRQLIYNSKNMNDMTELNRYLNISNKYYKYHRDFTDTDFGIYPRINYNGTEINGPKDTNISFNPSSDNNEYINGLVWPLGIFELPMFDTSLVSSKDSNLKYNTMFKNYKGNIDFGITSDPKWDFYTIIKNTTPSNIINRAMLLEIPNTKPSPEKEFIDMIGDEIKTITKYNRFLVSKMKTPTYFNPDKEFKLSDLIRNTIMLADIKPDEDVIFISNVCRIVKFPGYNKKYMINQLSNNREKMTVKNKIRERLNEMRQTSRGVNE